MLFPLERWLSGVKYKFSVRLVSLEPWPEDDCGWSVFWQLGRKEKNRGGTEQVVPVEVKGKPRLATVPIAQTFELSATLYASDPKQKEAGPYEKKECKLYLMQIGGNGEKLALGGNAFLNLADLAGSGETKLELPVVCCDSAIRRAVGRPKITLQCRAEEKENPSKLLSFLKRVKSGNSFKGAVGASQNGLIN